MAKIERIKEWRSPIIQFDEAVYYYGHEERYRLATIRGEDHRKAMRCFLQACRFVVRELGEETDRRPELDYVWISADRKQRAVRYKVDFTWGMLSLEVTLDE